MTVHGRLKFGLKNERYINVFAIRNTADEVKKYKAMRVYDQTQRLQHKEVEEKVELSPQDFANQWQLLHGREVESRHYWNVIEQDPALMQRLKEIEEKAAAQAKEEAAAQAMSTASKSTMVPHTAQASSMVSDEKADTLLSEQFRSVSVSVDEMDKPSSIIDFAYTPNSSSRSSSVLGKAKCSAHFAAHEASSPSEPPTKKHKN